KTQAALLEVMEEAAVTVDGVRHELEPPFVVVATMNPVEQAGTYALPEAQLDRFLMKTSLGHPDRETTVSLLAESATRDRSVNVQAHITPQVVVDMTALAATVHVDAAILDYVARLAERTRIEDGVELGVSLRGCLALTRCAKTWAAGHGRAAVIPDDIKQLATPVFSHRILLTPDAQFHGVRQEAIIAKVLAAEAPPVERGAEA
ncbi:MAG: MoxR family ATPase, partial [Actinomycetota bacterium]